MQFQRSYCAWGCRAMPLGFWMSSSIKISLSTPFKPLREIEDNLKHRMVKSVEHAYLCVFFCILPSISPVQLAMDPVHRQALGWVESSGKQHLSETSIQWSPLNTLQAFVCKIHLHKQIKPNDPFYMTFHSKYQRKMLNTFQFSSDFF